MRCHLLCVLAALLAGCSKETSGGDLPLVDLAEDPAADLARGDLAAGDLADARGADAFGHGDGVCSSRELTTGVLDPDCVYVIGTLLPGSSGHDALFLPSEAAKWVQGFGDHTSWPVVRPTDGRLVYHDFDTVHVWRFDRAAGAPQPPGKFKDNDDTVATPGCPVGAYRAWAFPDDGAIAYSCFQNGMYPNFNEHLFVAGPGTAPLVSGGTTRPIAVGPGRSVLLYGPGGLKVFDGAALHDVADAGSRSEPPAVRFIGGAFLVAMQRSTAPERIELLRVALDGAVTSAGDYQLGVPSTVYNECVLDPQGGMLCFTGQLALDDKVHRFSTTAPPVEIYADGHPVSLHISYLVTGS